MEIVYRGYLISKEEHPKLQGKYAIYDPDDIFVGRADSIKQAKAIITKIKQP